MLIKTGKTNTLFLWIGASMGRGIVVVFNYCHLFWIRYFCNCYVWCECLMQTGLNSLQISDRLSKSVQSYEMPIIDS